MLTQRDILFGFLIIYGVITCDGLRARIVNGSKAELDDVPYQASVQLDKELLCGGIIIDKSHVLTAAHCFKRGDLWAKVEYLSVVVGSIDLTSKSRPGTRYQVLDVKVHEKFNASNGWPNDIALLRLTEPIGFNEYVKSAILPKTGEEFKVGQSAIISGFGRPKLDSPPSPILYKTQVFIESNRKCQRDYRPGYVRSTNICTRHPTLITGTCEGDSGGPLTVKGKVIGIVSYSIHGCADELMGSQVHTRISEYIDWINYWRKSYL